ncbi:MAG: hypothetical protein HDQ93_00555 [Desulfovibrio sp.]|nr:hypothetical protein [Desulfovibrio sp.]
MEKKPEIVSPNWTGSRIAVRILPDERLVSLPRAKTARQLLLALGLEEETALVIRNGKLLTPDRQIWPNDEIIVRLVGSRG